MGLKKARELQSTHVFHKILYVNPFPRQVGKQTVGDTKDDQLKKDMPPTFKMVEDSTDTLIEASKGLAVDAESKPHKKMLLDGARG